MGREGGAASIGGSRSTTMKLTAMTAGLVTSALTLVPSAATRAADVRFGVGIEVGGGYHRGFPATFRHGYDRGMHEGYREGERDARRHERFGFWDEGRYRDSDRGYRGWMGPRYEYARGYRRGFEEGYARAYRRFARYDRYDRHDHYDRHDRYDRGHGRDYDDHRDRYGDGRRRD
jgi:hypothetical protein